VTCHPMYQLSATRVLIARMLRKFLQVVMLAVLVLFGGDWLHAQDEILVEEGPIIDQKPFDLIYLTAEAGSGEFKVLPIEFPNRTIPSDPSKAEKIQVVLVKFPERRYEIAWKWIEKIELYEDMVIKDALARLDQKDFIGAFQNLSFMMRRYPNFPRLAEMQQEFIWKSLLMSFQGDILDQSLSAVEELRRIAPNYKEREAASALNRIAQLMIDRYEKKGDLSSASTLLNRLNSMYGEIDVVKSWKKRIQDKAKALQSEAEQLFAEKKYRESQRAATVSLSMFPDLDSSKKLLERINSVYPMVRVGVMQRCGTKIDPSSLVDWAARRAGNLTGQPLFQFRETGTEGGDYAFASGTGAYTLSDDRKQLLLTLDPKMQRSFSAFELGQTLINRANPEDPQYDPSWAAIFESVETTGGSQLTINLRRPNVLPHALLQWSLSSSESESSGFYESPKFTENEASFKLRSAAGSKLPVEIVEIFYSDAKHAMNDLLRGDIDMIDQVYPADARRLAGEQRLKVMSYALPTTHMLIPISDHAYLAKEKFRRALLYAVNRKEMLEGELLNSKDPLDGRLISGPFPIGNKESDPLAYAYDSKIQPVAYNPQLAKLLVVIVEKEFDQVANKQGKPKPELKKLIVGCPDFEFARVAVQAMIQQWAIIGVTAEMKILSTDATDEDREGCDLIYVITTMWEPATDIERLLGTTGLAASDNPFIVQSLERVRVAKNWKDVRIAMQDMHKVINYHLPVLPLWQVTDRFVVRRNIEGVQNQPVSLYQNIKNWRIQSGSTGK
jgi:tetratricopeptide (TPR) repeat protein